MKKIDTIELIRSIREKQYLETKGKSTKDTIAYFKKKASSLKESQN